MHTDCTLTLSLFGTTALQLVRGNEVRPLRLCTQSRNLLAYLALARGSTRSRSDLSLALRDESDEPARPGSVNSALWRLRLALKCPPFDADEFLFKQRDGQVGLRVDPRLKIDVEAFLQHVLPALATPLDSIDAAMTEQLRRGVALYGGDLLPGAHDDWVLREREKLRRHQLNALGRLVQLSMGSGDAASGIRYAEAILEIDGVREDVHRDLMRLFLLAGQRALALRQYERCREILRRELSIVPMPETHALYQEIAAGAIALQPRPPAVPPANPNPTPGHDGTLAGLLASARRHIAAADEDLLRAAPPSHPH